MHRDPDARATGGDRAKCLHPGNASDMTMFSSSYKSDYVCLQCWGDHCAPFHGSTPAICAVAPEFNENCGAQSGGGPGNNSAVRYVLTISPIAVPIIYSSVDSLYSVFSAGKIPAVTTSMRFLPQPDQQDHRRRGWPPDMQARKPHQCQRLPDSVSLPKTSWQSRPA